MTWPSEVAERDHELQNPTSDEKIRLLGSYLRLTGESRVLDVACGKGGPALLLAGTYGCHVSGIEIRPAFAEEARQRAAALGLDSRVEVRTADAATADFEPNAFDAALCLGASFVWGTIADAASALQPFVRPRGFVAIGEPFWRRWPLPESVDPESFVGLADTVARLEGAGYALTGIVAASEDDWDRYESLQWRALEEWLDRRPEDGEIAEIRARHDRRRSDYVRFHRELRGWAIFVGRKISPISPRLTSPAGGAAP
jgi:SAM-dependent methyltransferase